MIELFEKRTRTSKSFSLGGNRFAWASSMGSKHYPDAEDKWQDIFVVSEVDGAEGFVRRFPYLPYGLRIAGDGRRRIYPDPRREPDKWVEFKASPEIMQGLMGQWGSSGLAAENKNRRASIEVQADRLKVSLLFKKAVNLPDTLAFDVDSQGLDIAQLLITTKGFGIAPPSLRDAEGRVRQLYWDYKDGQLTVGLNFEGLVFPVLFDPTVEKDVAADCDDCERRLTTSVFNTCASARTWGCVSGSNSPGDQEMGCGMRYLNATMSGTIVTAYFTATSNQNLAGVTCNTRISAEKAAAPATFSTSADFDGRARTTAVVDWDGIPGWTSGVEYQSPEIKTVFQELVDAYVYDGNDPVVVFWDDFDFRSITGGAAPRRNAYSHKQDSAKTVALYVEYTPVAVAVPLFMASYRRRRET